MKRSLLLRLGVALAAIFTLALIGVLSSVIITETAKGYAAAINQAGTLRMQSYRIASSLVHATSLDHRQATETTGNLVEEFKERLFSPRIHNVLAKEPSHRVRRTYAAVERQWQERIHPQLAAYLELALRGPAMPQDHDVLEQKRQSYLDSVDGFVLDIHDFVEALEVDAEQMNQLLRLIQMVSLVLMLMVASVSLYLAKINVLNPLRDLLVCATAARHGDFTRRSRYLSEDELGQLGIAFNIMAEDLSKMYSGLEARVRAKTADLERSNRSLELLYTTAKRLGDSPLSERVLEEMIHDIEHLLGVRGGTVCLGRPGDDRAFCFASTSPRGVRKEEGLCIHCDRCLGQGGSHTFEVEGIDHAPLRIFSTPIRDNKQQHGVLLVELAEPVKLEEWQQRLLETVASHIAMAINMAHQASQVRMLALLEERSVIARELHDSLAQSLSYLKIQVSRLEKTIIEDAGKSQVLEITGVLRSALNGAYRQLRDLLTTFRLRIEEADFPQALRETVQEFSARGNLPIEFFDHIGNCRFSPNAEIHLLQIIREALSNVVRHANATHAQVSIECDRNGVVTVLVEDDGVGVHEQRDMMQHYGLPIMQERAEWLGGTLDVEESEQGGTRIRLNFVIADKDQGPSREIMLRSLEND